MGVLGAFLFWVVVQCVHMHNASVKSHREFLLSECKLNLGGGDIALLPEDELDAVMKICRR